MGGCNAPDAPAETLRPGGAWDCDWTRVRHRRCIGAGQDLRAEAVALGAGDASSAEGHRGLGRRRGKGFRRHHQIQNLPVAAARQGVRPLRHGARRHRRFHVCESGLSARPLSDHQCRRTTLPDRRRPWRHACAGRLVPQICRDRDEGRALLLLFYPRSAHLAFQDQKDHGAGRHQGHEDPAFAGYRRRMGHSARGHQCAGQRHRSARRA